MDKPNINSEEKVEESIIEIPEESTDFQVQNDDQIDENSFDKIKAFLKESLETITLAVVLVLIINTISVRIRVEGFSMEPSFHNNNFVVVSKLAYKLREIQRGDVIVFEYPLALEEDFIKRVIGLPGDEIEIVGGQLILNGIAVEESFINEPMVRETKHLFVPENTVFVMGDNRNNSSDSRAWGPLPVENIIGKAVFVYWPFSDFGAVTYTQLKAVYP